MKDSEQSEYDYVNPSHYRLWHSMDDTFIIHKKVLSREEYIGFLKGNILKYQMRLGRKPGESVEREIGKIETYQKQLKEIEEE